MNTDLSFLVSLLEKAGISYHNDGAFLKIDDETIKTLQLSISVPTHFLTLRVMTDQFYDFLEDQVKLIDPSNAFLKKVGASVTKQKAKLPIQMSGLDKMTIGDSSLQSFTTSVPGPYVASDKLDGISIQVEYLPTEIKAYTRGDGIIGEDISYLIPYMNLPKQSPYTNIRGEIIMRKEIFNSKWSEEYENARNLVAGKVNAKTIHPAIHDMEIVIYGILSDSTETPSVQLQKLTDNGFNVVSYELLDKISEDQMSALLKKRKAESPYELDGIVVIADQVGLKHTMDSPQWGRKFKENTDFYEVLVTGITYRASKDGYLKPRLSIEPTRMGGVTVQAATGFNHKFIVENKLGVGAKIQITRSGDVIPHIVDVLVAAEEVFEPTEEWVWNETGVDAIVLDPDNHPDVKFQRIVFFFHTLQIDEVGQGVLQKIVDDGFDTVEKIIQMTQEDWKSVDGFAGRRGEISFTEMKKCMNNIYLPSLADACGFFGRGFGTTRFENILDAYPKLMDMSMSKAAWYELALTTNGIGETTALQFAEGILQFIPWVQSLKDYITFVEPEKTEVVGQLFKGEGVTFTGFRNADWQKLVEEQGGEFIDFGKKTTILVYGGKKSSKVATAQSKGIKTLTQGEFFQLVEQNNLA